MEDDAIPGNVAQEAGAAGLAEGSLAGSKRSREEMEAAGTEPVEDGAGAGAAADEDGGEEPEAGGDDEGAEPAGASASGEAQDDATGDKEAATLEHQGVTYKMTKVRVAVLFGYLGTRFQGLQK